MRQQQRGAAAPRKHGVAQRIGVAKWRYHLLAKDINAAAYPRVSPA